MNSSEKSRFPLKPLAVLLAVFLLGVVVGAGSIAISFKYAMQRAARTGEPHPGLNMAFERLEKKLTKQLELSPEQSVAVDKELKQTVENISQIRSRTVDQLDREARATFQRIAVHLPKEKHELLNEMVEERFKPWGMLKSRQ